MTELSNFVANCREFIVRLHGNTSLISLINIRWHLFSIYSNCRVALMKLQQQRRSCRFFCEAFFIHTVPVFTNPLWCSAVLPPSPCTDAPYFLYCTLLMYRQLTLRLFWRGNVISGKVMGTKNQKKKKKRDKCLTHSLYCKLLKRQFNYSFTFTTERTI